VSDTEVTDAAAPRANRQNSETAAPGQPRSGERNAAVAVIPEQKSESDAPNARREAVQGRDGRDF
jgi:hypothetical protein